MRYTTIIILLFFASTAAQAQTKNINLNSNQLFQPYLYADGTPKTINATNKNTIPTGCKLATTNAGTSVTRLKTIVYHPPASQLFPDDTNLSNLFGTFLNSLEQNPYFIVFFSKMHLIALHELYIYLMKIYTTFNMSPISQATADLTIKNYITTENAQALNKKTLIINHLVNVIEAQLNQAITTRFPLFPQNIATSAGTTLIKHDDGADINILIEKAEDYLFTDSAAQDLIKNMRTTYATLLGQYLVFFKQYTSTLKQEDVSGGYLGVPLFTQHALRIQQAIAQAAQEAPSKNTDIKNKIQALRNLKTINPPLFFYDPTTMRGIKIIPRLAKDLPANSKSVGWPVKTINDANEGTSLKNALGNAYIDPYTSAPVPVAFFKNSQGTIISGIDPNNISPGTRLYINIPTSRFLYAQELLPQPPWLNSADGIINILRACLGDFSALLDPMFKNEDILDPCLMCIFNNAASQAGIGSASAAVCNTCNNFVSALQTALGIDTSGNQPGGSTDNTGDNIPPS